MTTRIHIVNLGPDAVEVETTTSTGTKLWPHESINHYVYDQQIVTVKEVKSETKQPK